MKISSRFTGGNKNIEIVSYFSYVVVFCLSVKMYLMSKQFRHCQQCVITNMTTSYYELTGLFSTEQTESFPVQEARIIVHLLTSAAQHHFPLTDSLLVLLRFGFLFHAQTQVHFFSIKCFNALYFPCKCMFIAAFNTESNM